MKVLGIDPGSKSLGYAFLEKDGGEIKVVESGVFNSSGNGFEDKLHEIFNFLKEITVKYKPDSLAVEEPFYGLNVKTAIRLGEIVGVIKLLSSQTGIKAYLYPPRIIKHVVTGYGGADKGQVKKNLSSLLNVKKNLNTHESDAVAVGYCHILCRARGVYKK